MVVFLQADYGFVTFHVIGQIGPDAADRVLYDPVDKEGGVCHELAHPVRVRPLSNCPLQDVWLADSFEKTIEVSSIRYQRRLFQVSTTTVTGRVVIPQATALPLLIQIQKIHLL